MNHGLNDRVETEGLEIFFILLQRWCPKGQCFYCKYSLVTWKKRKSDHSNLQLTEQQQQKKSALKKRGARLKKWTLWTGFGKTSDNELLCSSKMILDLLWNRENLQISCCAEHSGKSSLCSERSQRDRLSNCVSWCAVRCLAKLLLSWSICPPGCVLSRVTLPCSAAALHCAVQGTLLQQRPREVGTNPEKDHKDAKGIRMNDLWWGKVKRTKCLEPLSLLHGHRNSNGVSCASTEESWIKSLSFYIPIKVTRAKQNGCSSLWTLCKKHLAVLLKVQDVVSHCQGTLWLFKNQHRISMRLAKSQRPEKESTCSGMAGVTLAVIFDLSWCSGLFLSSMHLHPTRTRYVLLPAGREQEGPQL